MTISGEVFRLPTWPIMVRFRRGSNLNWLTPEKRREISVIGEDGMLTASYLTQDVWFTESPTKQTAEVVSRRWREYFPGP